MMITSVETSGRRLWQREMHGRTVTIVVFPHRRGSVFELFAAGQGRVGSLGRFDSRAAALRFALGGGGHV